MPHAQGLMQQHMLLGMIATVIVVGSCTEEAIWPGQLCSLGAGLPAVPAVFCTTIKAMEVWWSKDSHTNSQDQTLRRRSVRQLAQEDIPGADAQGADMAPAPLVVPPTSVQLAQPPALQGYDLPVTLRVVFIFDLGVDTQISYDAIIKSIGVMSVPLRYVFPPNITLVSMQAEALPPDPAPAFGAAEAPARAGGVVDPWW